MERLKTSLNEDQADFESKNFRGRRFSDLQKDLKSMHISSKYPVRLHSSEILNLFLFL